MPNPANILYERDYNYTDVTSQNRRVEACLDRPLERAKRITKTQTKPELGI